MIDIQGGSKNPIAARLSNFTDRTFVFDGVACASIEGVLQALKAKSPSRRADICAMSGRQAKAAGTAHNDWKEDQLLYWMEDEIFRSSQEYQDLITRIYDAVYEQDSSFKQDLLALGLEQVSHIIGHSDPRQTVLTEVEMIYHINRLRLRALAERAAMSNLDKVKELFEE